MKFSLNKLVIKDFFFSIFYKILSFFRMLLLSVWTWLVVLLVAYLAPTFNGVKPAEVHLWYWRKFINSFNLDSDHSAIKKAPFIANPFGGQNSEEFIEEYEKSSSRRSFSHSTNLSQKLDLLENDVNAENSQGNVPLVTDNVETNDKYRALSETGSVFFLSDDGYLKNLPNLLYEQNPYILSGKSFVYNANALDVVGNYVLLFGIYVNPESQKGKKAMSFLENLIENKEVSCKIVAKTKQNVLTGICFYEGVNLNKKLVLEGLSENVAL